MQKAHLSKFVAVIVVIDMLSGCISSTLDLTDRNIDNR